MNPYLTLTQTVEPETSNVARIMKYLNLGCGNYYHRDWINVDLHSNDPQILSYDLRKGIPLPEESCDVVYHSNIIEHFQRDDALTLLRECFRVLKPGGILRVATPNLEQICKIYFNSELIARIFPRCSK